MDILNTILEDNKIPLKIIEKYPSKNNIANNCSPSLDDTMLIYMLINTNNNDVIGFIALEIMNTCVYINYRCVRKKYRGMGFGIFLAFVGVYYTINNKYSAIFSIGAGNEVEAPYERKVGGKKWVLSQGLLINKLGFYDNYKTNTYDIIKVKKNTSHCGETPETILYIDANNLSKYYNYMNKFKSNTSSLFYKYIRTFKNNNNNRGNKQLGGKEKIKDKRYGKYKHGNHTHKTMKTMQNCRR